MTLKLHWHWYKMTSSGHDNPNSLRFSQLFWSVNKALVKSIQKVTSLVLYKDQTACSLFPEELFPKKYFYCLIHACWPLLQQLSSHDSRRKTHTSNTDRKLFCTSPNSRHCGKYFHILVLWIDSILNHNNKYFTKIKMSFKKKAVFLMVLFLFSWALGKHENAKLCVLCCLDQLECWLCCEKQMNFVHFK